MRTVRPDEVKEAVLKAGITRIDHHDCGGCGYMTSYRVVDGQLFFDPGCDCSRYGLAEPERRGWVDASDWINMQSNPEHKESLARKFGLDPAALSD